MPSNLQFRRGTRASWELSNPVLLNGEVGIELPTNKYKIGDGTTSWKFLPYAGYKGTTGANATGVEQPGVIEYYPSSNAPTGWLPCDGSTRSRSAYPTLSMLPGTLSFSGGVGAEYGPPVLNGAIATASSINYNSESYFGANNAFDGVNTTDGSYPVWSSEFYYSTYTYPWLKISLTDGKVFNRYYLTARPTPVYTPTDWHVDASNDNTNWVLLDSQSMQTLYDGSATAGSVTTANMTMYSLNNTTAYKHYRITVTNSTDGNYYGTISEMAFVGTPVVADNTLIVLPTLSPMVLSAELTLYPYIKI